MQKTFVGPEMFDGSGKREKAGSRAGGCRDVEVLSGRVLQIDRIGKEYM